MSPIDPRLDHLVLAVPDLDEAIAEFAARTGVQPAPGGRHDGRGTANALIGLGGSAYLEIIGPDPAQPGHSGPRPFGVSAAGEPRLATWAIHPDDLDALVASARAGGYDPGEVEAMSRRTPEGDRLSWRLTAAVEPAADGVVPFLIDWGTTPHPTTRGLPVVPLLGFRATHPDPDRVRALLALIGADLEISTGTVSLAAVVEGRQGPVEL